ncbi:leucine-rich repeat-containing protein 74B-like [Mya arenaria]|uniref:leucine-rich repeat-containing protein 74B-like n=1 Tax=Mya arenaria TaxID=6604 RepID=UPI0022E210C0|nr:leucine-rich repeat-containing protein 74B-like [Mya arenaria]
MMPGESPKVGGSPLPTVTPPRLQSPSKAKLQSRADSRKEDGLQSPLVQTPDAPRELNDKEPIFLTDISMREMSTINEDFEGVDCPDTRVASGMGGQGDGEGSGGSGVSSMSEEEEEEEELEEEYDTDLELEPDKWLNPELYDHDTTGVNRYLRMCTKLEIQPITYFLKHMQDRELIMKYHGLGPLGVKAMSDPLETNTTIERMDLEGNYMLGVGATYLANVLKDNVYVTQLILSENKMGNIGAKAICELLVENKTITYLDLKGNYIEDGVAENFYDMLSKNTDLKTLILRHNNFEDEGARWLRDSLMENDTLVTLDLSWNHFQWRGCCAIAEGMVENTGIKSLNLCMNGFGLEGSVSLEEMLKSNRTLLDLDISFCRIPLKGAPHIASGIQNNEALERLDIGYNQLQNEGGYVILVGEERNETAPLKHIDFGNLTVKPTFKKLADRLEEERGIEILYGGVMLDVTSFRCAKYDPWAAHANDPMTKLKQWLDKTNFRLVDLLLTFDRTGGLSIDLEELKNGIHNAGIDMTDIEIDLLMKKLDDDNSGTIDMKELMQGDELNTLAQREAIRYKEEQDRQDTDRRRQAKKGDPKDFQKIIQESDVIKPVSIV